VTDPEPATFTVVASGDAPLSYQWRRDGVDIEGETTDTFVLDPTSYGFDNGAQFDVVVSNPYGSITGDVATLTVNPTPIPPSIDIQPADMTVTEPAPATFTVVASGDAPLSYQWRRDGVDIDGETTDTFVLDPTSYDFDDGAQFDVVVSSPFGFVASEVALLMVNQSSGMVSDDFDETSLNTAIWTYIDPLGDSALSLLDGQVFFDVPAGSSHFIWGTTNSVPRIMQVCNDVDFEIEVKFDSQVNLAHQLQGILIEEDSVNSIVMEFDSDGTNTQLTYSNAINGEQDPPISQVISPGAPLYMRIKRVGDTWTISYSHDETAWTVASTFDRTMTVTSVGVFGGNFSYDQAPQHTAVIDYFYNTSIPKE
jgi:regulation of enolase protein 1 (concanavalin A-like superfamily)